MALTRPRAAQIYDIDYKQATRVVTVANITLAGGAPNAVDGVNLSLKDRVLVTGQSTASENGIYYVTTLGTGANGTWTRSLDTDATGELLAGTVVMVTEGTLYADTQWKLTTNDPIVIGTTALTFVQNYLANSISSGNSNVVVNANSNVTISSNGTANVLTISSTGVVVTGTTSSTGNITGANILTGGIMSSTGNATHGNILTGGLVSATGNINGNYLNANIYYATGFSASRIYLGNSEVNVVASGGNINVSVGGSSNVAVFATTGEYVTGVVSASGNITGSNLLSGGLISVAGNATFGNLTVNTDAVITGNLTVNGNTTFINSNTVTTNDKNIVLANNQSTAANVDGGGIDLGNNAVAYWRFNNATTSWQSNVGLTPSANASLALGGPSNYWGSAYLNSILAATTISAVGTVTGGNLATAGTASASGNITGGNILTAGLVSATGNVNANYLNANIYYATGFSASRIFNGNSEVNIAASGSNVNVSVGGTSNVWVASTTGIYVTGLQSVSGNITGSNLLTGGLVSATSNITGGNILTAGIMSSTGNAIHGNILSNGQLSVVGNIVQSAANSFVAWSYSTAITAAGTTQANAYVITATTNQFSTVASGSGAILPAGLPGQIVFVANDSANALLLYPPVGGLIDQAVANAAVTISAGGMWAGTALTGNNWTTISPDSVGTANQITITQGNGIVTFGLASSPSVSGNITGGNILTAGAVSATGNITGSYLKGNGSQISNVFAFSNIGITGQNTINASSIASTLTFTAGNNIILTGNTTTNSITIDYSSSGGSSIFATGGDMGLVTATVTSSEDLGNVTSASTTAYDLGVLGVQGVVSNSDIIANTITGDKINSATYISVTGNLTAANLALTSSSTDVRGWWYTGNGVSVSSQEPTPTGVSIDAGLGTKMYVVGTTNKTVYQYALSTAYNPNTATYGSTSFSVASQDASPQDIKFNSAGTSMYVLGGANAKVFQYSISSGDVSTASYGNLSLAVNTQEATPTGLVLSADGANLYVVGTTTKTIYQYTLSTPGNVATGSYAAHSLSVSTQDSLPAGLAFNSTGTICWMIGSSNKHVYQYNLSDPYNIASGVYASKVYVGDQESTPTSLYLNQTAGYAYVIGNTPASVFQYGINNATIATANALYLSVATTYLGGNLYTQGNVTSGNLLTVGIMSSTGNATHGNVLTTGQVSATGNVTGNNIVGNLVAHSALNITLQQNFGGF